MARTLGIDASTQSISILVLDSETSSVVAEAAINFGQELPNYAAPNGFIPGGKNGEVHADPCMWLDALELCLERLSESGFDLSTVEAISGAGQQHGTVYLNDQWLSSVKNLDASHTLSKQLAPCFSRRTAPIWMDHSTGAECVEIASALRGDAVVCSRSGSTTTSRFSGPQIRRFSKTEPEAYKSTKRIHLVSSFLASVLAGCDAPIDYGDGAGMNLMNLQSLDWDSDLLTATANDLHLRLPDLVPSSTNIGTVASFFVKRFGFKANTAIIAFTGDNPSSLVGMGAAEPDKLVISLGTSDTVFSAFNEPITDPQGFGHVFGNPLGGYMALACFRNGSLAREQVKQRLGADWSIFGKESLSQTPPGNNGNLMLPYFEPEITPRLKIDAPVMVGSKRFQAWGNKSEIARACLEGQFINLWLHTRWMSAEADTIYLTGGASVNDGIAQVIADVFNATVQRIEVSASVALGAAIRAAAHCYTEQNSLSSKLHSETSLDPIKPDPSSADSYSELKEHHRNLIHQLLKDSI